MSGKASVQPSADAIRSMTTAAAALALLVALPVSARADCSAPSAAVQIPDGSTATRDQMVAAQREVKAYDTAVKTYGDCLQHELDTKVAGGGNKELLEAQYDRLNNAEVDKLQRLAGKFNDELRAFKAKNSG